MRISNDTKKIIDEMRKKGYSIAAIASQLRIPESSIRHASKETN